MVHNGEINTIRGNADKMRAREETMEAGCLKGELHKVLPAINTSGSDSAMLDNALEFMVMSGMDLPLAVMICIPEPWINNKEMSQNKKDFYQYYATMMEPWDGPASILFSDGDVMGAVLDRNGLRPSRYYITDDDNLILSSEVGVLDIDPSKIVMKERLHPGKMLLVDTVAGRVIDDEELKEKYANQFPYGEWLDSNLIQLKDLKGNTRSLTDLKGKVVLIDFTVYNNAMSAAHNLALRELYNKYASQGFEIYQISLDGDEHFWKTSADNLPWVCVRDANGVYSSYISLYNVTNLPSIFLVNHELSARGENIKDLDEAIKKLL